MKHHKYNPNQLNRRTIRIPSRDYTATSAYFVTLRAYRPEPIFEIPKIRELVLETWRTLPNRFPTVTLDEFIIMPDHIHLILWLNNTHNNPQENTPKLGDVIGAYKSIISVSWLKHIKSNKLECAGRIWHRNYYERIVRIPDLEKTRAYIRNNPNKFQTP
jgi:putative transposase